MLTAGCTSSKNDSFIAVTIEPQRFFAEKIAGKHFKILTVVPPGQDPETYDATPRQMLDFNRCTAYLLVGHLGFEQTWIKNILENNPDMKSFDLSEGFALESGDAHDGHAGVDPHIWSSIDGARTMARNILKAFVELDLEHEEEFKNNYEALMKEIDRTEAIIRDKLASATSKAFVMYHPALTYFAREFGLKQICFEIEGKNPTVRQSMIMTDLLFRAEANVVFEQPEVDGKHLDFLARSRSCRLVRINLMSYNWSKEMIKVASALANE
jgi:zinc transport system substrate-binding protein